MTNITHKDVFNQLEVWAPSYLAYDWDNVGLQVGTGDDTTKKVMVTLDILESVVDEAISKNVNLIIAHHPLLFKPLKQIDFRSTKGKIIKKLIEHEITAYAAHTNLDIAQGGVNDLLMKKLKVNHVQPFVTTHEEKLYKLSVFVPLKHVEQVRNALSKAGAGHIGNYSHCTFQTKGHGTFKPLEGTNPYIGSTGELEIVDEMKIETIVPEHQLNHVITAMKHAHPYEEVAYDIFPLNNKGKQLGIGRIATLKNTTSLEDFIAEVKHAYELKTLRVTGDLTKIVKKIAIVGGSGQSYMKQAIQQNVDVLITGDVTFHIAQDAQEMGLAIIDAGHYIEHVMKEGTKDYLKQSFTNIDVVVSETNTDPFQYL